MLFFLLALASSAIAREPVHFRDPGVDSYVLVTWGRKFDDARLSQLIERIASTGAKRIVIPVVGCQKDKNASVVDWCSPREKDQVFAISHAIQSSGLGTSFIPIIFSNDGQWRGDFEPTDVRTWFATYGAWIKTVARFAASENHSEFVAASELTRLYPHAAEWIQLLRELRAIYKGPLVVTVNQGDHVQGFWNEADAIGVSAYYPLVEKGVPNPSLATLENAWRMARDELVAYAKSVHRPLHLTEVGYRSADAAAEAPWDYASASAPNPELQRRCFEAFARTWRGVKALARVNVWASEDPEVGHSATNYDPIGKPAEHVIARFMAERAALLKRHAFVPAHPTPPDELK